MSGQAVAIQPTKVDSQHRFTDPTAPQARQAPLKYDSHEKRDSGLSLLTHDEHTVSRKRCHSAGTDNTDEDLATHTDGESVHSPKRRRSSNWPLKTEEVNPPPEQPRSEEDGDEYEDEDEEQRPPPQQQQQHQQRVKRKRSNIFSSISSVTRRQPSNSGRPSKFHESSMHDRPSEKPPSIFTRLTDTNTHSLTVDHLMEDYMDNAGGPSADRMRSKSPQAGTRGLTRQPNQPADAKSNTSEAGSAPGENPSGIFRLGRAVVDALNPVAACKRIAQNWRDVREELRQEMLEEHNKKLMTERQVRAEEAYAELKRTGQLPANGPKAITKDAKILTRSTTPAREAPNSRDSGVEIVGGSTTDVVDAKFPKRVSSLAPPNAPEARKPTFSFRSPSLSNLKKVRSEKDLAGKRSQSRSASPEKDDHDNEKSIHKTPSRKDLQRQHKLVKRVSDLEVKLEEARRELRRAMGDLSPQVPPVPPLPADVANVPPVRMVPFHSGSASPTKNPFVPGALPSLPSERLLCPDQVREESPTRADSSADEVVKTYKSKPLPQPPKPTGTSFKERMKSKSEAIDIWTETAETPKPKETSRKKVTKKRKSPNPDDSRHKPSSGEDDDTEREVTRQNPKRKRTSRSYSAPTTRKANDSQPTKLTKPKPSGLHDSTKDRANAREKNNLLSPSMHSLPRISLETVEEERTITIPLNDEPKKATAVKTPSHPSHYRHRTPSPGKSSRMHGVNGAKRAHSSSPPPMPKLELGLIEGKAQAMQKEQWEWPDDVF